MKKSLATFFLFLFLFSFSPVASAESQTVCINKVTGQIRVSATCDSNESQGSLTIPPVKVSKVNKIKLQIQKAEEEFKRQQEEFNLVVKDFGFSGTANLFCVGVSDGSLYFREGEKQLANSICSQKRALDVAQVKMLDSLNLQLEIELKGYKTITCKKGNLTLTVTDLKPKCPKGYKLKAK